MNVIIPFKHYQSAHCETGVTSNLMRFHGLQVDEPLVFGIGSGIFYSYFPFIKMGGIPVTSYRILPGAIFKRFSNACEISIHSERFWSKENAMKALDRCLDSGKPVGMLTSVFYLTYLPAAYRFHFNAHNIVVFGKNNDEYLVSDPVMDTTTSIHRDDLIRARFAKGIPEPNGRMYYPILVNQNIDLRKPVILGMKKAGFDMTRIPLPIFATRGMRYVAKRMPLWPQQLGDKKAIQWLANMIRMQEEIGTGGGGFRFVYAAFLQQAAAILQLPELNSLSMDLTKTGDLWRNFAWNAGKICKNRKAEVSGYKELADMIYECSIQEDKIFTRILEISKSYKF